MAAREKKGGSEAFRKFCEDDGAAMNTNVHTKKNHAMPQNRHFAMTQNRKAYLDDMDDMDDMPGGSDEKILRQYQQYYKGGSSLD